MTKNNVEALLSDKLFYICLFCFISFFSNGQNNLEQRLTKKAVNCQDIALNSVELYLDYVNSSNYDSAHFVLEFWESNCGIKEPIVRAKIILNMLSGKMTEEVYDSTVFVYIDNFITRYYISQQDNYQNSFENYAPFYGYIPLKSNFDSTTAAIARQINTNNNNLEELFKLLYGHDIDGFYYKLQEPEYEKLIVRNEYDKKIKKSLKLPDGHFDVSLGLFKPTNTNNLVGNHPTLGLSGGLRYKRITYDLMFDMRFGNTKSSYQVVNPDTIRSNYFFGGYFGFDVSYDILNYKRNELSLLGGIGVDGFDTEFSNLNNNEPFSIGVLNFNGGLMYKRYINSKNYIGFSYKYNIVDYSSSKILGDLSGNYHTFRVSFGIMNNSLKRKTLNELRYMGDDNPYYAKIKPLTDATVAASIPKKALTQIEVVLDSNILLCLNDTISILDSKSIPIFKKRGHMGNVSPDGKTFAVVEHFKNYSILSFFNTNGEFITKKRTKRIIATVFSNNSKYHYYVSKDGILTKTELGRFKKTTFKTKINPENITSLSCIGNSEDVIVGAHIRGEYVDSNAVHKKFYSTPHMSYVRSHKTNNTVAILDLWSDNSTLRVIKDSSSAYLEMAYDTAYHYQESFLEIMIFDRELKNSMINYFDISPSGDYIVTFDHASNINYWKSNGEFISSTRINNPYGLIRFYDENTIVYFNDGLQFINIK